MRRAALLLAGLIFIASCSTSEEPILHAKLSMSESTRFESASFSISDFQIYGNHKGGSNGVSMIQRWDGVDLEYDLSVRDTSTILIEPHFGMEVWGVKPYIWMMSVTKEGVEKKVEIARTLYIELDAEVQLMENSEYEVLLQIDTDAAIDEVGDKYVLDMSLVDATIRER